MKLFVGLDVSLEKTAICVISEHGKILKEVQVTSEPEALSRWINDQDGAIAAIGLLAGPLSQRLYRGLSEAGQPVVLMDTRQVKGALRAMPIKTDRRDAEGIARLLHLGWFRPVHCKSVSAQEVRAVLSARKGRAAGVHHTGNVPARAPAERRPQGRHNIARPLRAADPRIGSGQSNAGSGNPTHAQRAIGAAARVGGP